MLRICEFINFKKIDRKTREPSHKNVDQKHEKIQTFDYDLLFVRVAQYFEKWNIEAMKQPAVAHTHTHNTCLDHQNVRCDSETGFCYFTLIRDTYYYHVTEVASF